LRFFVVVWREFFGVKVTEVFGYDAYEETCSEEEELKEHEDCEEGILYYAMERVARGDEKCYWDVKMILLKE